MAGLNDEQGRQLRITVASLRQQLGFERQQRARTAKEIAELRSHSSTSSRAGQAMQQQVCTHYGCQLGSTEPPGTILQIIPAKLGTIASSLA